MALKCRLITSLFLLAVLNTTVFGQAIDSDQSTVSFIISNLGFKTVEGSFSGMTGTITFDTEASSDCFLDVCIDASTINTENEKRDKHLKNEDFFDVAQYPTICFTSSDVTKNKRGYSTTGTLTMHGVTKTETIQFTYTEGVFFGTLKIDRKDYAIGPKGGFMVGKEAEINIVCKTN